MTKKKKIINALIFLAGIVVFAIYYFEDNRDMDQEEKKQEESAKNAADSIFDNVFNESEFDELVDSTEIDSL